MLSSLDTIGFRRWLRSPFLNLLFLYSFLFYFSLDDGITWQICDAPRAVKEKKKKNVAMENNNNKRNINLEMPRH